MRRLIIAVLVLVGMLLVADFGAAALAESAVSRQLRSQLGLADDPSVRINGFPFLVQAASGEYVSVDLLAQRVPFGELRELGVRAQLRNVSAPLPMLLGDGPKTLHAKSAEGTVQVSANDVQRLAPGIEKLRIEPIDEYGLESAIDDGADPSIGTIDPDNAVRLVGTSALLPKGSELVVIAETQLADGQIRITPRDVRIGGTNAPRIPAPVQQQISRMFTMQIDPGALPLRITPTKLRATPDGLEISGRARDLTLGGTAVATGS